MYRYRSPPVLHSEHTDHAHGGSRIFCVIHTKKHRGEQVFPYLDSHLVSHLPDHVLWQHTTETTTTKERTVKRDERNAYASSGLAYCHMNHRSSHGHDETDLDYASSSSRDKGQIDSGRRRNSGPDFDLILTRRTVRLYQE